MMRNAIVGHTGFVGSNLCRQVIFDEVYNSKNIETISGKSFDILVFSGAPASKWEANHNPIKDWQNLERAMQALYSVRAQQLVLISTIDVIPYCGLPQDETVDCAAGDNHAYGTHRFQIEQILRTQFYQSLTVRLPALFGWGLKKNVIYDLLHDNMLERINLDSTFQYYDISRLWKDIQIALENRLELVHLFTQPIATQTIVNRFFSGKQVGQDAVPSAHYDHRTRYADLYGGQAGWIESADRVLDRLESFINTPEPKG